MGKWGTGNIQSQASLPVTSAFLPPSSMSLYSQCTFLDPYSVLDAKDNKLRTKDSMAEKSDSMPQVFLETRIC